MLRDEGIQFQVCRNPDVKCAAVERAQRMIRDRLYKYFTYKNTFSYIEILPKFVRAYNDTVHSTTGMARSRVTDSPIEGQFYEEELTPVSISKETTYKIDKILDKRVRRGIRGYLVQWKGYSKEFES